LSLSSLLWPFTFIAAILQARRIVSSADLVIGFGGYVSAPCYLAARFSGVPLLIHEANAIPGWANKLGAKFADEVLTAFSSTSKLNPNWSSAKLPSGMRLTANLALIAASEPYYFLADLKVPSP
jgi:UDP-N-acetylglucosamine--N-acetylmuramyl-(pentapeptide) pyrophosphoryl-undecaprenol N-acetylglucosamine transferase